MDFCTSRKWLTRIALPVIGLIISSVLVGCLSIQAAYIRITGVRDYANTMSLVQESLRLLGWAESERMSAVCKREGWKGCAIPFESSSPSLDGYAVHLRTKEDATLEITFATVARDSFSAEGISAYRDLVSKLQEKLNGSVQFDKETNHHQSLY